MIIENLNSQGKHNLYEIHFKNISIDIFGYVALLYNVNCMLIVILIELVLT